MQRNLDFRIEVASLNIYDKNNKEVKDSRPWDWLVNDNSKYGFELHVGGEGENHYAGGGFFAKGNWLEYSRGMFVHKIGTSQSAELASEYQAPFTGKAEGGIYLAMDYSITSMGAFVPADGGKFTLNLEFNCYAVN